MKAKKATKQSRTLPVKQRATFKVVEAARYAGCGERSIRDAIARKENTLPHVRFGRTILIPKEAFRLWLESCGGKQAATA